MTDPKFVPVAELEVETAMIVQIVGNLHPLQRATLFRMIATDLENQFPDSLTLGVLFKRLSLEYEHLLTRDESH